MTVIKIRLFNKYMCTYTHTHTRIYIRTHIFVAVVANLIRNTHKNKSEIHHFVS